MQTVRAFISSTWVDLREEREAVEQILHRLRQTRFVGMEYSGSQDDDTRTASLADVDRCDIYIGIVGHRYGSGITEDEYWRARERRLPCLIYIKDGDPAETTADRPDDARRRREWESALRAHHTVSVFSTPFDLAAKVAADLHNFLFDKYLVDGIDSVGSPYAERIQNFLSEYTGTADQPVPFGGRDDYFAVLNGWLDRVDRVRLLMLAAPAGRGKSALLVRWSRTLAARDDLAVVFFPVSIRFNTNLAQVMFPTVAARLATLHGEVLQVRPDASVDMWRGLVANYLARPLPLGRRLLLILDGIDEAADWEAGPDLFPYALAAGTGIVVSARYVAGDTDGTNWLRRLGWDRPGDAFALSLDPLTHAGVADVLDRLGTDVRTLSTRVDVVAELHRLSEGDPLLVRLYVTALSGDSHAIARLAPEDLQQIRPGLEGFFARWWDDQRRLWGSRTPLREPAVQTLLNVLACALGPLRQKDLLQLCPPESGLSAWTLEEALIPISRFVVGDGAAQGYAFSHPRLGSYFYERLQRAGEAGRHEARYIEWGTATVAALRAGKLDPAAVSHYLIQYFTTHLERAQCDVAIFRDLVSAEWRDAWSVLDQGSFTGFLGDVRRVWRAAAQADAAATSSGVRAPYLDVEIRCALCVSSVSSIAQEIPTALLVALVRQQVWTPAQGLAYASNIAEDASRVHTLLDLADAVTLGHRDQLLSAAMAAARSVADPEERDELLARVAPNLSEPLAAVRHIHDAARRLDCILSMMPGRGYGWNQKDLLIDAATAAQKMTDRPRRIEALSHLSRLLPEPHRRQALDAMCGDLDQLLLDATAAEHLPTLASCLPEPLLGDAVSRLVTAAWIRDHVQMFRNPDDDRFGAGAGLVVAAALEVIRSAAEYERPELLLAILPRLSGYLLSRALAVAEETADPSHRANALMVVARRLPEQERYRAQAVAIASLRNVQGPRERATLLASFVAELPVDLRSMALSAAIESPDPSWQVYALGVMMTVVTGSDRAATGEALLGIFQSRSREGDVALAAVVIRKLAGAVPDEALIDCINRFETRRVRVALLRTLADSVTAGRRNGVMSRLLTELESACTNAADEAFAAIEADLGSMAPLMGDELLLRSLRIAMHLRDRRRRARAVRRVLEQASPAALEHVVHRACAAAAVVEDLPARAGLLCEVAWDLQGEDRRDAFAAALDAVTGIESEALRADTLLAVTQLLPDDWLPRAVDAARGLATPLLRVRVFTEIATYAGAPGDTIMIDEAVAAVQDIADPLLRARVNRALKLFAPRAAPTDVVTPVDVLPDRAAPTERDAAAGAPVHGNHAQAEEAVRAIMAQRGETRLAALRTLLRDAAAPLVERVLFAVGGLPDDDDKAEWLAVIAAVAPSTADEVVVDAFHAIARIPPTQRRDDALLTMIGRMQGSAFDATLMAIGTMTNLAGRVQALMTLGRTPYTEHRDRARAQAVRELRESQDPERFSILDTIAVSLLPPELIADAFDLAATDDDVDRRARQLQALAAMLPEERRAAGLRQALTAVQDASFEIRCEQMRALAWELPPSLFGDALQTITDAVSVNESNLGWVIATLRELGRYARHQSNRDEAVAAALEMIGGVADPSERIDKLFALAAALPEVGRGQALSEALRVAGDATERAPVTDPAFRLCGATLRRLLDVDALPTHVLGSAIGIALRLPADVRGDTLHLLAKRMPRSLLPGALVSAAAVDPPAESVAAIDVLLESHKSDLGWDEILDAMRLIKDESHRARATAHLARHVPMERIQQVLDALRTVADGPTRARAFADVAELLSGPLEREALVEAWRAVRGLDIERDLIDRLVTRTTGGRADLTRSASPQGDRDQTVLHEAVATALAMAIKSVRVTTVSKLAPYLPAGLLRQALTGLQKVRDEAQRATILTAIGARLEDARERATVLAAAERIARSIFWPERRARALAALADHASGHQRDALMAAAVAAVRPIRSSVGGGDALRPVVERLADTSESVMREVIDLLVRRAPSDEVVAALFRNVAPTFLPRLFLMSSEHGNAVDRIRLLEFDSTPPDDLLDAIVGLGVRPSLTLSRSEPDEAFRDLVLHLRGTNLHLPPDVARRYQHSAVAAAMIATLHTGTAKENLLALAFERLAKHWSPDLVPTLLIDVCREFPRPLLSRLLHMLPLLHNEAVRADVLRRMTILLDPSLLPDCIPVLLSISDHAERARTMERLLPLLPRSIRGLAARARALPDPAERALALRVVALHGGGPPEPLLQEALDIVTETADLPGRGDLLCNVVGDLPDHLLPTALRSLRRIDHEPSVAEALELLIPGLHERHFGEVLATVDRFRDDVHRVLVLRRIARDAPVEVMADALVRVEHVRNPFYRAHVLEAFAPRLPAELVPRAITLAAALVNAGARARTIAVIASSSTTPIDESILVDAVQSVTAVADEAYRVTLLSRLVPNAPAALVGPALPVLHGIGDEFIRAAGLRALLPHVDDTSAEAMNDAVSRLQDDHHRAVLLAELSERVGGEIGRQLMATATATAAAISGRFARAEAWRDMVRRMAAPHVAAVASALSAAYAVGRPRYTVDAIVELAPAMTESLLDEAYRQAQAIAPERERVRALVALAPHLTLPQFGSFLEAGTRLRGEAARLAFLSGIAPHVPEPLWPAALRFTLQTLRDTYRAEALVELAPSLPAPMIADAFAAASALPEPHLRAHALAGLGPFLPPRLVPAALDAVDELVHDTHRCEVLEALIPALPDVLLDRAVAQARGVSSPMARARLLGALAASSAGNDDLLRATIDAIGEIEDHQAQAAAICRLPSPLPLPLQAQARSVAEAIDCVECRPRAQSHLGSVPVPGWEPVFAPVLEDDRPIRLGHADRPAHSVTDRLSRRLAAVAVMESERDRVVRLRDLAPGLSESDFPTALRLVGELVDEGHRAEGLIALAPHVPVKLLPEAWTIARGIRDDAIRLPAVTSIAPGLAQESAGLLHTTWCDILQFLSRRNRASLLDGVHALLPVIGALGEPRVMRETAVSVEDVGTWWP